MHGNWQSHVSPQDTQKSLLDPWAKLNRKSAILNFAVILAFSMSPILMNFSYRMHQNNFKITVCHLDNVMIKSYKKIFFFVKWFGRQVVAKFAALPDINFISGRG